MNPIEKLKEEAGEEFELCSPIIKDDDSNKELKVITLMRVLNKIEATGLMFYFKSYKYLSELVHYNTEIYLDFNKICLGYVTNKFDNETLNMDGLDYRYPTITRLAIVSMIISGKSKFNLLEYTTEDIQRYVTDNISREFIYGRAYKSYRELASQLVSKYDIDLNLFQGDSLLFLEKLINKEEFISDENIINIMRLFSCQYKEPEASCSELEFMLLLSADKISNYFSFSYIDGILDVYKQDADGEVQATSNITKFIREAYERFQKYKDMWLTLNPRIYIPFNREYIVRAELQVFDVSNAIYKVLSSNACKYLKAGKVVDYTDYELYYDLFLRLAEREVFCIMDMLYRFILNKRGIQSFSFSEGQKVVSEFLLTLVEEEHVVYITQELNDILSK